MGLRLPIVGSQRRLELLQGLLLFAIAQKQAGQLLMAIGEIRFERDVFAIFLLGFLVILKVFKGEAKIEMQEREFRVRRFYFLQFVQRALVITVVQRSEEHTSELQSHSFISYA